MAKHEETVRSSGDIVDMCLSVCLCVYLCTCIYISPTWRALMFTYMQVRSLEKELEEHREHKPKSGRSGRTAVSGGGGDGTGMRLGRKVRGKGRQRM